MFFEGSRVLGTMTLTIHMSKAPVATTHPDHVYCEVWYRAVSECEALAWGTMHPLHEVLAAHLGEYRLLRMRC